MSLNVMDSNESCPQPGTLYQQVKLATELERTSERRRNGARGKAERASVVLEVVAQGARDRWLS